MKANKCIQMAFCPFRVLPFEPSSLFSLSELATCLVVAAAEACRSFPALQGCGGAERGHLSNRKESKRWPLKSDSDVVDLGRFSWLIPAKYHHRNLVADRFRKVPNVSV